MNKTQVKAILRTKIAAVTAINNNTAANLMERAKLHSEIYTAVNWRKTGYKGWKPFVELELETKYIRGITIIQESYKYTRLMQRGYKHSVLVKLATEFGAAKVLKILPGLNKLTIKEARRVLDSTHTATGKVKVVEGHYFFFLSEPNKSKFEKLLIANGMTYSASGKRSGISNAMEAIVAAM